ncbi:LacI family DNA-binding transcriptional regulator [Streptomyces sp. NL15-2K]|uniref:LacI family DNA-binding transcriptional regulator n=1 Tax=Streptomyces sp. NL15-2K TaxID=376149 RepID=UPI000F566385|nr:MULTISPECIES: LacI family DNA-binding transcriptional regulator [Actinomycetes]WKX12242.1 LacI family DNA-binding transcriptional regulator [Kutzneria buriramensis]
MASVSNRVTLAQIAEYAGVSVATVSKVVNGRPDVAQQTRDAVLELMRQHNYGGNRDDLRSHPTVELFFGFEELSIYCTAMVQAVVDAGVRESVGVVVSRRGDRDPAADPAGWAHNLAAAGRRAVIAVTANTLSPPMVEALSRVRLPLVLLDPEVPDPSIVSVGSTYFAGGRAATTHLLSLGHRRIAYLGGKEDASSNQARLHGFRSAMEAAGVPVLGELVRHAGSFHTAEGVEHGKRLLAADPAPTAVFAACDELAAGVIEAARLRGLRVPEDLSVVGFDDTPLARVTSPPLSTVHQPINEMGAVALRTALRLASAAEIDSHHVELATRLVVRDSTGPVPADTDPDGAAQTETRVAF